MSDPSIRQYKTILKTIIDTSITPFLVEARFKNTGTFFYRTDDGVLKLIEVERFRFNTRFDYHFWLNVLLFGGDYQDGVRYTMKLIYENGMPFFSERIGKFWDQEDHMYELRTDCDEAELSDKIKHDLTTHVFPFFAQFESYTDLIRVFPDNSYAFAVMLAKMGKKEESKEYFIRCIEIDTAKLDPQIVGKEHYIENLKKAALQLGIEL